MSFKMTPYLYIILFCLFLTTIYGGTNAKHEYYEDDPIYDNVQKLPPIKNISQVIQDVSYNYSDSEDDLSDYDYNTEVTSNASVNISSPKTNLSTIATESNRTHSMLNLSTSKISTESYNAELTFNHLLGKNKTELNSSGSATTKSDLTESTVSEEDDKEEEDEDEEEEEEEVEEKKEEVEDVNNIKEGYKLGEETFSDYKTQNPKYTYTDINEVTSEMDLFNETDSEGSGENDTSSDILFETLDTSVNKEVSMVASLSDYPYVLSLQKNFIHQCTGTLINPKWVLTVARCLIFRGGALDVEDPSEWIVAAGQSVLGVGKQFKRNVKRIYINSRYTSETDSHNIALVELTTPYNLKSDPVKVVTIARKNKEQRAKNCFVLGWPHYNPSSLLEDYEVFDIDLVNPMLTKLYVNVSTNYKRCLDLLPREAVPIDYYCLRTSKGIQNGICIGDSGGPLLCRKPPVQVGLYTVSDNCSKRKGYALKLISHYTDWIEDVYHGFLSETFYRESNGSSNLLKMPFITLILLFLTVHFVH